MTYTRGQLTALVLLRVAIGWHFLFEGASKLLNSSWSAKAYLLDSKGIFSGLFISLANNESFMRIADQLNVWGLTFIGLGLVLGLFSRAATIAAMLLIMLYYFSHPACLGFEYMFPAEGSYFIINKNIIELLGLLVLLLFPTGHIIGMDRFFIKKR
jgi:thiosulfate dehydrogenase [quinone] large subunit